MLVEIVVQSTGRKAIMLGDIIANLDRADLAASLLSALGPDLFARIEVRAAAVSMTPAEFASGAVREFVELGDDELWFQLLTLIRKAEDPSMEAIRTVLQWAVTSKK
jgi:hypothetical protein